MKLLLSIIFVRNSGQLGWVKFVPKPPSKGFGNGELVDEAVEGVLLLESIEVADAVSVADATTELELAAITF